MSHIVCLGPALYAACLSMADHQKVGLGVWRLQHLAKGGVRGSQTLPRLPKVLQVGMVGSDRLSHIRRCTEAVTCGGVTVDSATSAAVTPCSCWSQHVSFGSHTLLLAVSANAVGILILVYLDASALIMRLQDW